MATLSKKDEAFRTYALSGSPLQLLLKVCTPLALYQALTQMFKILDALMASHISSHAVSAVSCLSQITLMITAIGSGLAVGGSIKISEAYGKGDYEKVQKLVASVYIIAIVVSLLIAAILIPFAVPFLRLLNTPQDLIDAGLGYFRIEILSLMISFFNTVYIAIERSRGHAKKILNLNLAMIAVKLTLSAIFVYGMDGGLIHIALATLAGHCMIFLFALYAMPKDEGAFRFTPKAAKGMGEAVLPILNLAYPVSSEKLLFNAGKVIVNSMSGFYGSTTVGALGISNNIGGLTTNWHMGFTDGAAPLISQNRGAGHYKRTLQLFYWLVAIDMAIGVIGLTIVSFGLPWIADVFAQSKNEMDPVFREMIISIHKWEMLGYITLGVNSAVVSLLLGYGYTKLTFLLNVTRVFLFRVPVLWYFQHYTQMGAEAVGITMMISNVATGVTAVLIAIPVIRKIHQKIREEENA